MYRVTLLLLKARKRACCECLPCPLMPRRIGDHSVGLTAPASHPHSSRQAPPAAVSREPPSCHCTRCWVPALPAGALGGICTATVPPGALGAIL